MKQLIAAIVALMLLLLIFLESTFVSVVPSLIPWQTSSVELESDAFPVPRASKELAFDEAQCPPGRPISILVRGVAVEDKGSDRARSLRQAFFASGYAVSDMNEKPCVVVDVLDDGEIVRPVSGNVHLIIFTAKRPSNYTTEMNVDAFVHDAPPEPPEEDVPTPLLAKRNKALCFVAAGQEIAATNLSDCHFVSIKPPFTVELMRKIFTNTAIPVIPTRHEQFLPLRELIPWRDIVIFIQKQQFSKTTLKERLKGIDEQKRFNLRREGRRAYNKYFADDRGFVRSLIESISHKLLLALKFGDPSISAPLALKRKEEKLTAVFLTYNRDHRLTKGIETVAKFPVVDRIIVVWNYLNRTIPATLRNISTKTVFIIAARNELSTRFLVYSNASTDAVLSLDDDIRVDSKELTNMFKVWQDNRDRVVSYAPRKRAVSAAGVGSYDWNQQCHHEMGLTGYAVFHKKYLYEYAQSLPAAIRQHVREKMNCEDIAFNYHVAHLTGKAAILPDGSLDFRYPTTMGDPSAGISGNGSHLPIRNNCILLFDKLYGYSPLVPSFTRVAPHEGRSFC